MTKQYDFPLPPPPPLTQEQRERLKAREQMLKRLEQDRRGKEDIT